HDCQALYFGNGLLADFSLGPRGEVGRYEGIAVFENDVPLDDGEGFVEDRPHDAPVGVEAVSHPRSFDQFPEVGLDVARPNLPCVRGVWIEKLTPVEAEELVALVGDAPVRPFAWTWVQHGLKTLSARLY